MELGTVSVTVLKRRNSRPFLILQSRRRKVLTKLNQLQEDNASQQSEKDEMERLYEELLRQLKTAEEQKDQLQVEQQQRQQALRCLCISRLLPFLTFPLETLGRERNLDTNKHGNRKYISFYSRNVDG